MVVGNDVCVERLVVNMKKMKPPCLFTKTYKFSSYLLSS